MRHRRVRSVGARTPGKLGLWGLLFTLNLGCGIAENPEPSSQTTTGARTSTESGSGGDIGEAASSNGAPGGSGGAFTTDTEGTTASNLAGAAGIAGAAGAGPDERDPPTCDSFPHEDPSDGCEPKLRAILSSRQDVPLLTFEYDDAGRLATVGDDRSHGSYFKHRYRYDDQGRLSRFEDECDPERAAGTCATHYEFTYAEAGWLQTMRYTHAAAIPDEYTQETYGADGRVLERLHVAPDATFGTLYRYRSDGQIEALDSFEDDNGDRTVTGTEAIYEYGDDDLLDHVVYHEYYYTYYDYLIDEGRVRVEHIDDPEADFRESTIFDDFGRPAFEYRTVQADDRHVSGYVDGIQVFSGWGDWATLRDRYPIDPPRRMFPYRPFDLTAADIDDFNYSYNDIPFARRVRFAEEGLLEHATLSWGPSAYAVTIETQRCGGVVLETTRVPTYGGDPDDDVIVYYYGCDDFVLPTPLPEL